MKSGSPRKENGTGDAWTGRKMEKGNEEAARVAGKKIAATVKP
jgi:hypothetical protein